MNPKQKSTGIQSAPSPNGINMKSKPTHESDEVVFIPEPPDPSIELIVKQAQEQPLVRRMMGIEVPPKRKNYNW